MILDLEELEPGQELAADVAVVGAGAAGIALALELGRRGRSVLLLESGGLDTEGETQDLYEGDITGVAYDPLSASRARFLGGTTAMWTGWCKPLDAADLAPRPWLGLEGWPIGHDVLQPWYERAVSVVECGAYRFDRWLWAEIEAPLDDFSSEGLEYTFWQKSPPTRFGSRYREDLARSTLVRVVLHANLVDIGIDPERGHVTSLALASLGGHRIAVRASAYVLACGGIENARLLLAACSARPEGLGNEKGQVGRCFMEHPHWDVATIHAPDSYRLLDSYYRRKVGGRPHRIGWSFSAEEQARLGVMNCSAELDISYDEQSNQHAISEAWQRLSQGRFSAEAAAEILAQLQNLSEVGHSWWRKHVRGTYVNKPVDEIRLMITLDPLPNPESRVALSRDRDALGLRRTELHWQLSDIDERSIELLATKVATGLTRLGLARVRLHPALGTRGWGTSGNLRGYGIAPELPEMSISWHHMGTTRMSTRADRGVVDADCQVHGVANLFVAGSSVFPTVGNANPTLTIVALAMRLADHLVGKAAVSNGTG